MAWISGDARTGPAAGDGAGRGGSVWLIPGNLLVSESFYSNDPNLVAGQTQLPPGCTAANCVTATANGSYLQVFNNALVDGSFGVTSRITLAETTPSGRPLGTIEVPANEFVTSFSSKSELALNLSPDGRTVSFMGYVAKPDTVDVSNANTPGVIDPARRARTGSACRPPGHRCPPRRSATIRRPCRPTGCPATCAS